MLVLGRAQDVGLWFDMVISNLAALGAATAGPIRILALGDSLTAGYMLNPGDAFPAKLEAALKAKGYDVRLINAGVSGDTTAGGRARLSGTLADKPDRAIVELGVNDALCGVDPARVRDNLDAILSELTARGVDIFLAGMIAPRDMGPDYAGAFDAIYPGLQKKYRVPLYPFFLDGVLEQPAFTFYDGLHPTAAGIDVIVAGILPHIERWLGTPPGCVRP